MLAGAGYVGTEGYGDLYANNDDLNNLSRELSAAGLAMKSGHFSLSMVEADPDWVLHVARTLGMERVFVPWLDEGERPVSAAEWHNFGARLQHAGAAIRAAGFGFGWHNHDFEFVPTSDGTVPMEALLHGGPDLEWEMDVAWVVRGGADAARWIGAYGPRITSAHVKDIARQGLGPAEDGWCDVGDGLVEWPQLLTQLRAVGCSQFILEHDNPSDDRRFATRSITSVKGYWG